MPTGGQLMVRREGHPTGLDGGEPGMGPVGHARLTGQEAAGCTRPVSLLAVPVRTWSALRNRLFAVI